MLLLKCGADFFSGSIGRDTLAQPLPLVVLGTQCAFRKEAIATLDGTGIPWRIAATSPSLASLCASAKGGLGLTLRTALGLPHGLISGKTLLDLPSPRSFLVTPHTSRKRERRGRAPAGDCYGSSHAPPWDCQGKAGVAHCTLRNKDDLQIPHRFLQGNHLSVSRNSVFACCAVANPHASSKDNLNRGCGRV